LTWRNRSQDVVNVVYNFYSPGDQVFDQHTGYPSAWDLEWGGRYTWCLQEKLKGRMDLMNILGSIYGGWGFNNHWSAYDVETNTWDLMPAEEALALSDETLREHPFFDTGIARINGIEALYNPTTGSDWAFGHHSALLSEFVPALSLAAGFQFVELLGEEANYNMQDTMTNGWSQDRLEDDDKLDNWLHNDVREMAYTYVYRLFDEIVRLGGFAQ